MRNPGGEYNQLSTSLLQIENEFYGTIRPKRVIFPGERPLHALRERGVEYVEVRCMDLDPFVPVGIRAQTTRFIDVFLLHCLLTDSPPDSPDEIKALGRNQNLTASRGREPGLMLERGAGSVSLVDWGAELVEQCRPIAAALDGAQGGTHHHDALQAALAGLREPLSLPSAQVLQTMARDFDSSYVQFTRAQSMATRNMLLGLPHSPEVAARFKRLAQESIDEQARIEAADSLPFEVYRQQYLSPDRLSVHKRAVQPVSAAR